ncbi:hypothetical protein [Pelagimonas phthalicica]|uniref:hypothetical protein n=1 Tax=Pelagimonas phthalicica TaxID=1037362 RepID=UPI00105E872B|nr:hypothetical protein [Pelagimonas phthalicica]
MDFLIKNADGCAAAISAAPGADAAQCVSQPVVELTTLGKCVELARSTSREANAIIKSDPEWLKLYNAFFSELPDCAASDEAVSKMFECLAEETGLVQLEYTELGTIDTGEGELNPDRLRELACTIPEERMLTMVVGAKGLRGRATVLDGNLGDISTCRKNYTLWLDERGDFCSNGNFPNCELVINFFQDDLRKSLDGAEAQSKQISSMLTDLNRDLDAIFTLGFIGPQKCE